MFTLETEELIDRSMEIVGKVHPTGHFYYKETPVLEVTAPTPNHNVGDIVYGIYEHEYKGETYVWCRSKYNGRMSILKANLKVVQKSLQKGA